MMTKWEPYMIGAEYNPKFKFGRIWYMVRIEQFGWKPLEHYDNLQRMDQWDWGIVSALGWYDGRYATRWLDKTCAGAWGACYQKEDKCKFRMFFEIEDDMSRFKKAWISQLAYRMDHMNYKWDEPERWNEADAWSIENCNTYMFREGHSFYFSDANDLMRFKLVWGGDA